MHAVHRHSPLEYHLLGFSRYLRSQGLITGVQETLDVLKATALMGNPGEKPIKYITRALFCNSKEDHDRFDYLFENYWKGDSRRFRSQMQVSGRLKKKAAVTSLIWLGNSGAGQEGPLQDSKETTGANAQERLRKTDFAKISEIDSAALEELAQRLWLEMSRRLSRRLKDSQKIGTLNIRRTIRKNISSGGEMLNLAFKKRKPRKPRLVVFLDVSGSMDKYSFYLLRFIYALQQNFKEVESFLFSTRLQCISDVLKNRQLPRSLEELKERAAGWSSGTTIGACFKEFNRLYAGNVLSRQSVVLILSDGLDTGDTSILRNELARISQRSRKLIWLNPLKGMKGYQPLAKGMSAVLPMIDVFSSAHNLESLLKLEKHLQNVS